MKAKSLIIYFLMLHCFFSFLNAQNYIWPLSPVSGNYVRSTFCEYRTGPPTHFHEGIDIPAQGSYDVYATTDTFKYIGKFTWEDGWAVVIQHYSQDAYGEVALSEGSRYIHMYQVNPDLVEEEIYIGTPIAENTGFDGNHLHFEIRDPEPLIDDPKRAFNPFMINNLCAPDGYSPVLDYLYADGNIQGSATIDCWNFLGYYFNDYYNETIVAPFVRLTLPETDTRDYDLDDPHIIISDNCKVRFILKAKDEITSGYENCAPYWISLYLDTALALSSETEPFTEDTEPFYEVKFEYLLNSTYDEVHDEEDVYYTDSPLQSTNSIFYYRLYPIDVNNDGYPRCILSGRWTVLETESLDEGQHRIRIVVEDYSGHKNTADAHFGIYGVKGNLWGQISTIDKLDIVSIMRLWQGH